MLQSASQFDQPSPRPAPEFPAPAQDLAAVSFHSTISAPALEETVAGAVLDELDFMLEAATGRTVVAKILKELGTNKTKAIDDFAVAVKGASALQVMEAITNVTREQLREICPHIDNASPTDPEAADKMAREVTKKLIEGGRHSLRDLAIECITRISDRGNDSRKHEVTRQFDRLLEDICNPGASEMALLAAGGAGRTLISAAKATGAGLLAASKATGLFLFHSTVTQSLPFWLKRRLSISNWLSDGYMVGTGLSSIILTGAAQGLIVRHLLSMSGLENHSSGGAMALGAAGELVLRLLFGAVHSEEENLPGMGLLELASIPFRLGARAIRAMGNGIAGLRDSEREKRRRRLEDNGLF